MISFYLNLSKRKSFQHEQMRSFAGGKPKLPSTMDLPKCRFCANIMTFFFQVAFPEGHCWYEASLAVFQCTACYHDNFMAPSINTHTVPFLTRRIRAGEPVPDGVLDVYQHNFRFVVFETNLGVLRRDYVERVQFSPMDLIPAEPPLRHGRRSRIGGLPTWVQKDESPGCYQGTPLEFIMQLEEGLRFETVPDAPRQFHPMLEYEEMVPKLRPSLNYYSLFSGTQVYVFGNLVGERWNVWAKTQSA